ncbi:MAG: 5-amino-6-(D-ribitylamino)uracil--L-tyrosine 4-hydroxyphenyl transferase CofH [Burkholderiales bacterium]|nr:5-amino-6-(D-ribitylamino)uracil--L-tyrosine 4-hydroxyphenyl transferase CofH [Burkholderiales bacterium]
MLRELTSALNPDLAARAGDVLATLDHSTLPELCVRARALREAGHGVRVSYSRKVFIPLTRLCRNTCGYCTFVRGPKAVAYPYLRPHEVLEIARLGAAAGCKEALFALGDRPEAVHAAARGALEELGYASTVEYLAAACALVLAETGLLPHVNAGVLSEDETRRLREVSVSQGLMLESVADRLCDPGGPHHGCPDKRPAVRLEAIEAAGRAGVPFTSGILIGIGETRLERVAALLALKAAHARHGHLQEVIVQSFRAKPGTRMRERDDAAFDDLVWTAAAARLILGAEANIQVPPNLSDARFPELLDAGINDWGGISPVTDDYVNPEHAWPSIETLGVATRRAGLVPIERLAIYPAYAREGTSWLGAALVPRVLAASDGEGYARTEVWSPGVAGTALPAPVSGGAGRYRAFDSALARALRGGRPDEGDIVEIFGAREGALEALAAAADDLRAARVGETVRYVVNRNINYTNVCAFHCRFCAYSKGKTAVRLRGQPYDLALEEVARRVREAWARGATEVCMQGGIHPAYTGDTYLALLRAVKDAEPRMHVHAFSPLEVTHGARTLGVSVPAFLARLRDTGLGSLPGTAAEILDDAVRARICPDKLSARQWLDVVEAAHRTGLRTTATILFGHVEAPRAWARHLLAIRDLQARTGGFTEFVPLPFVHMEAPMYLKEGARRGPTWRETLAMHAVARLVLHSLVPNIQVSWVKLGLEGAAACLTAGANDLGGTLMNESISRAAGNEHGEELPPAAMEALIRGAGRRPEQRTTLYQRVDAARHQASFDAPPLVPIVLTPVPRRADPATA